MVYTSICVASILVLRRVLLDKRESGMYHSCQTFYDNNSLPLSIFSVYWNIQKKCGCVSKFGTLKESPTFYFLRSQPISPLQALSLALVFLALAATNRTIPHKASIPKLVDRRIEESKILRKRVSKFWLQGTWEEPDVCWASLLQTDTELSGKILTDRVSDDRPVFISPERVHAMSDPNLSRCRLPRNKPFFSFFHSHCGIPAT